MHFPRNVGPFRQTEIVTIARLPLAKTHYANNARVELAAFDAAVTDWELYRGFERL